MGGYPSELPKFVRLITLNEMIKDDLKQKLMNRIKEIPIVDTLNIQILNFEYGYCEIMIPLKKGYEGIYDSFHGGLMMTAADSVACFAILTLTGPDANLTTTDMNIRFLYPCYTNLTARAKVIKYGRTLCPVSVDLYDDSDSLVAVAQVTYMLLDKKKSKKEK